MYTTRTPDAFVWDGKRVHRYKTGNVPQFDFSNVLFDPAKHIEQPHVYERK
jgi:hypothetical protein